MSEAEIIELVQFLGFPGCSSCLAHPCMELRFGRRYPGKLELVSKNGVPGNGCPLVSEDRDEIAALLSELSLQEIIFHTESAIDQLNVGEAIRFRLNRYCSDYRDRDGRVAFLNDILDEGLVRFVRIPSDYESNPKLKTWFGPPRRK